MRKNIKNDKVLKAITIGLAAMIATTSVPVTVLADESDNSDSPASNESIPESTEETTEASSEKVSVSDASNECNEIIKETAPETVVAIDDAAEAVSEIETADSKVVKEIQYDLAAGKGLVEDAAGELGLGAAVEGFNEVLASEVKIEAAVSSGNDEVNTANTNIANVNAAVDTADKAADNTLDNADTANTSASRTEAYAAKDSAEEALSVAEAGLAAAQEAYELADEAAAKAQADLDKALIEQEEAQKNLDKAKEALDNADGNAIAANASLKAAQAKMDAINAKVEKLAENKEQLEAIQHQYYAMMVSFFRLNGNAKNIVYYNYESDQKDRNEELIVNIEETAKKLKENPAQYSNMVKNDDSNYLALGRYLTKLLVEQMILSDENVDPETANIQFGIEGGQANGKAGTVFTNWSYEVQTAISGELMYDLWHKDKSEKIEVGDEIPMQWMSTNQGDAGRSNYVRVDYIDKDGNLQTKRYNYVRKNSAYGDELDIENGMFYLAEVEKVGDKWEITRITDNEYNFDDYNKLMNALEAITDIEEYNAAKAAVDEAQGKVQALQEQIERLKNVTLDNSAIENLRKSLETAQAELAAAGEAKDALEEKVAEARAAVESIDLSRFNVSQAGTSEDEDAADEDTTATDEDTTATEAAAPTAAVTPASVTVTVPGLGIDPIVLPAAGAAGTGEAASRARGVAGVRVPAGSGNGAADEAADIEDGSGIEEVPVQGSTVIYDLEEIDNSENGRKLVRIEDNAVPLAATPEEAQHISWWWLLIIALLGATGKKMYDEHQKKAEAAEAQK